MLKYQLKFSLILLLKKLNFANAPSGVKCLRPSNLSCAHPTTCKKNGKCFYS